MIITKIESFERDGKGVRNKLNNTVMVKKEQRVRKRKSMLKSVKRNWLLYVFLLPVLIYVALFCYWPMYGLQIAFQRFRIADGFSGSEWVGLYWIEKFINGSRYRWLLF